MQSITMNILQWYVNEYDCFHNCSGYGTGPGKIDLSTQNTLVRIMAHISCSVCAIQHLLVLLNSSWISAYMMTL